MLCIVVFFADMWGSSAALQVYGENKLTGCQMSGEMHHW